uniref:Cytochrome n=1 Tax=Lutzomyia longipalpis TaxID=7200 RepID=A0A1B0CLM4_LUTLO
MLCINRVKYFNNIRFFGNSSLTRMIKEDFKDKKILDFQHIPKAKGLPLLGTTLDIMKAGSAPKFHEYIHKRHEELGSIFRENIGPLECLFVSDPDAIREVFLNEGKYPRHPLPDAWKLYERKHRNKRGLLFMDGEEWLYHRKQMNKLLLNRDFTPFHAPIKNSVQRLMDKWATNEASKPIENLENDLYRWSLETIINLMVGSSYNEISVQIDKSLERLSKVLHRVFESSSKLFLVPPQLCEFFGTSTWRDFEESVTETLSISGEIITKCLNEKSRQDGILREMENLEIPREYIERILVDLIIAAGDTTSFSTLWCLHILSGDTNVQENLREEIRGNDTVEADLIPPLRAFIRETLRLYPVAPFVGRIIGGDKTILGNYHISQEVMAIISLFTSGRDPKNFHDPEKFNLHRWCRSEESPVHRPQASLPFALGSRSCIGQKIAVKQMCELLRQVLQRYQLQDLSGPAKPILHMITVPDRKIQVALKKLQ